MVDLVYFLSGYGSSCVFRGEKQKKIKKKDFRDSHASISLGLIRAELPLALRWGGSLLTVFSIRSSREVLYLYFLLHRNILSCHMSDFHLKGHDYSSTRVLPITRLATINMSSHWTPLLWTTPNLSIYYLFMAALP